MEANIKEKLLTFSKGMSNIPSDIICDDDSLADCVGLRLKDGELKAVQSPSKVCATNSYDLLYVHKTASFRNLIVGDEEYIMWYKDDGTEEFIIQLAQGSTVKKVVSIGNILVVATTDGLYMTVFKSNHYTVYDKIPEPQLSAYTVPQRRYYISEASNKDDLKLTSSSYQGYSYTTSDLLNNLLIGAVTKFENNMLKNAMFLYPRWFRVGVKLFDGSVVMLSNPYLVLPTVRYSCAFVHMNEGTILGKQVPSSINMQITVSANRTVWENIIDSIVVYASDSVRQFDLDSGFTVSTQANVRMDDTFNQTYEVTTPTEKDLTLYRPINMYTDDEIMDALVHQSVFYKIAELPLDSKYLNSGYNDVKSFAKSKAFLNLTTQEQLDHDDYYGHTTLVPNNAYTFNNRLQISNIKRYPFIGFKSFDCLHISSATTTAIVTINCPDGVMKVSQTIMTNGQSTSTPPNWFYYPDPNAVSVNFGGTEYKLTVHPRLNGAYLLWLPNTSNTISLGTASSLASSISYETLSNTVMTSEVNNPWTFNADGDNMVGTGEIIGIVSNTRALSQGQFGQHPLIVFTNEGIYALGTTTEGLYSTNYPLSREVCNNANSITATDGAVFFTSEKGLMMMVGSEISCVSQQMMGKTGDYQPTSLYGGSYNKEQTDFLNFIKSCSIAYDYRDYCLYLINSSYYYCYVYDIKSGAFTRINSPSNRYVRVVNDYPDNLLQDTAYNIWSLINKPDINEDTNTYNGILMSRPVKMGSVQVMKSLREVAHLKSIAQGSVVLHVYTSNNLTSWVEQTSLKGRAWKYFRFGLELKNMKATDSYTGMLIRYQPREANKLR